MQQKLLNGFKDLDLFSKPIELYLKKDTQHKTFLGAFFSFGLMFLVFLLGVQQAITMLSHSNPQTILSQVYEPQPNLEILTPKNFTFTFGLEDGESYQTYLNESIAHTFMKLFHKYQTTDATGNTEIHFDEEEIPIVPCTIDRIQQPELKQYLKNYDLPTLYCIDFNKIQSVFLQGMFDSDHFRYMEITVKECRNETKRADQPNCMPKEIIDGQLNMDIFAFQFTETIVDLQNPYTPHQIIGKDIYTTISNKIFKHIDIYFQPTETYTDFGLVMEDEVILRNLKYFNHIERMDFSEVKEGDPFFRMMFRLDNRITQNFRSYLKIQDILSNLGGLWQVLFVVFMVIVQPFNELSQKSILVNSLFNFEGQIPIDEEDIDKSKSWIKAAGTLKSIKTIGDQNKSMKKSGFHRQMSSKQRQGSNNNIELKKSQSMKDISLEIKKYFKVTSKKLIFDCYDYFQLVCSCFKISADNRVKKTQLKFSAQRLKRSMDIVYIIKKLNEVDKLKMILLNEHQIKLFDYMQKPTIDTDPFNPEKEKSLQNYWSILKKEKSDLQTALDAQKAYQHIVKNSDIINKKIVQMLDENVIQLFQMNLEQDQGELSPKVESDCQYQIEDEERFNPMSQQTELNPNHCNIVSPRIQQNERILSIDDKIT